MELGLVNVGLPAATAQSAVKPPCGSRRVAGCVFCVIGNAPELAPGIVYLLFDDFSLFGGAKRLLDDKVESDDRAFVDNKSSLVDVRGLDRQLLVPGAEDQALGNASDHRPFGPGLQLCGKAGANRNQVGFPQDKGFRSAGSGRKHRWFLSYAYDIKHASRGDNDERARRGKWGKFHRQWPCRSPQ